MYADTFEQPSWVKILAKPKLYLGDVLTHGGVLTAAISSVGSDLAKSGFGAILSWKLCSAMMSSVLSDQIAADPSASAFLTATYITLATSPGGLGLPDASSCIGWLEVAKQGSSSIVVIVVWCCLVLFSVAWCCYYFCFHYRHCYC